jgi:asparagine synthase (glutamine-hydrolysing)
VCGIAGVVDLRGERVPDLSRRLAVMGELIRHRGPDDAGTWEHANGHVGLANRRLSIIDLEFGRQPMADEAARWITFNGEIYNYPELRRELDGSRFLTGSDTEVLLRAYGRWGLDALLRLRGMFAVAIWDEARDELVLARDRFGIKPLYYARVGDLLYFASEIKALLPFLPAIETHLEALKEYLAFQFCLPGKTLFRGVHELRPGHHLVAGQGAVREVRYWDVYYNLDWDHTVEYFERALSEMLAESVELHLRSDVPVAAYLSGGLDSSTVAALARSMMSRPMKAFNGRFPEDAEFDESRYARAVAHSQDLELNEVDLGAEQFVDQVELLAYHLDQPTAGPGSFPQFVVSAAVSHHVKVVLGGQGGDEIFGGYARYLIAYFEQCIKAAIDGTMHDGTFVVTYESIIPTLSSLRGYKPLLKHFWRDGVFEDLDARYFRLINRTPELDGEVRLEELGDYSPFETFREIFNGDNVGHRSYFDKMTHFDFKTLLPALLHVEDRVSMAHGLEARVPMLDHRVVELASTIPADKKFKDGGMKHMLKRVASRHVPDVVVERTDKMGFPVPLTDWMQDGPVREFVRDVLSSDAARDRALFDNQRVLDRLSSEGRFGRKTWGLLSLELWQRTFHDRASDFRRQFEDAGTVA